MREENFEIKNLRLANGSVVRRKILLGNLENEEKDELQQVREEELDPMSYAKVFGEDQYIVHRPVIEGR